MIVSASALSYEPGRYVGQICYPQLVRPGGHEVTLHQVRQTRRRFVGDRRPELAAPNGPDRRNQRINARPYSGRPRYSLSGANATSWKLHRHSGSHAILPRSPLTGWRRNGVAPAIARDQPGGPSIHTTSTGRSATPRRSARPRRSLDDHQRTTSSLRPPATARGSPAQAP